MASSNACWGIEIGAGAVKAIKVVSDGDSLKVVDFALIPHARVLSTPDIDPDDAKRVALGRLVSEHDLSKALVAVSVPGHSAFARFAKLPTPRCQMVQWPQLVEVLREQVDFRCSGGLPGASDRGCERSTDAASPVYWSSVAPRPSVTSPRLWRETRGLSTRS